MVAEALTDIHGCGGREWFGHDGGIAQKIVKFHEDEFGDGHVPTLRDGFDKCSGALVIAVSSFEGRQENVGIERDHRRGRLRVDSSSAEMS